MTQANIFNVSEHSVNCNCKTCGAQLVSFKDAISSNNNSLYRQPIIVTDTNVALSLRDILFKPVDPEYPSFLPIISLFCMVFILKFLPSMLGIMSSITPMNDSKAMNFEWLINFTNSNLFYYICGGLSIIYMFYFIYKLYGYQHETQRIADRLILNTQIQVAKDQLLPLQICEYCPRVISPDGNFLSLDRATFVSRLLQLIPGSKPMSKH